MNKQTDAWAKHWTLASELGIGAGVVDTARYTSPEVYDAERDKIFRRVWLMVGRESEVPNPGDFIKREIPPLDAEAVIVRGKDGILRAFHNACAHRGSALVGACEGSTSVFVCPYHGWSYGTDGKCKAIPGAEYFPQVDKKTLGLTPIHLGIWNGFVFVNFDETPRQTLAAYLGKFGEAYADIPFHEFPHGTEIVQDVDANWKNFLDAFAEGYHVPMLHKKTLPMVPSQTNPLNVYYDAVFMPPHYSFIIQSNPDWVPDGDVLKFIFSATGTTMLRPLEGADTKLRMTRLTSCKGINPIGLPHFGLQCLYAFPFSQIQVFEDRYMWYQFWPIGLEKTRFVLRFYSRTKPASYLEQFAEAHMLATTRDVVTEDVAMTRLQQRGMKSGGQKHVHLGENELLIRHTHQMIQDYLNSPAPA